MAVLLLGYPRQVSGHQPGCLDRIVAGCIGHHQSELVLDQHRQLVAREQHGVVSRDETVPQTGFSWLSATMSSQSSRVGKRGWMSPIGTSSASTM